MTAEAPTVPDVIPDDIAHLDFDPKEEKVPGCVGFVVRHMGRVVDGSSNGCPNTAKVRVMWACCGMIEHYCLDCYNAICQVASDHSNRAPLHGKTHEVQRRAFSQVDFL